MTFRTFPEAMAYLKQRMMARKISTERHAALRRLAEQAREPERVEERESMTC